MEKSGSMTLIWANRKAWERFGRAAQLQWQTAKNSLKLRRLECAIWNLDEKMRL